MGNMAFAIYGKVLKHTCVADSVAAGQREAFLVFANLQTDFFCPGRNRPVKSNRNASQLNFLARKLPLERYSLFVSMLPYGEPRGK
jgi:hypothetical protein